MNIPARISSILRLSVACAVLFTSYSVRQNGLVHPLPVFAAGVPHEACCGAISAEGYKLTQVIDSMHVEERWLAHEHVNWETGEPDRGAAYEGPGKATHCSAFAAAMGERLGVYMLRPPDHGQILLASAQA